MNPRIHSVCSLLLLWLLATELPAGVRVRDLATVAGARDNQLVGYGLVVGLAGDGDKDPTYTVQTLANVLQQFGVNIPASSLSAKNVAVVMVTADIPAFLKPGARLDVTASSLGDAKSLQGGVLLQTPLYGADGRVYAVAQGPVYVGGFSAGVSGAGGANAQKNHPTVAQIIGGALVEREIPATVVRNNHVELLLREPDFTSAAQLAAAINEQFAGSSTALDSTTVRVSLPEGAESLPVDFIARLQAIEVTPDTPARIIINERTGTIVATARIQVSHCAVSHGNLSITIAPHAVQRDGDHRDHQPHRHQGQRKQGRPGGVARDAHGRESGRRVERAGRDAATIAVHSALAGNPGLLQASGVNGAVGNNEIALQLAQLADKRHATLGDQTFSQRYAQTVSGLGQSLATANSRIAEQQLVENMLRTQRESISGVSLDEEMADLVKFQRAFEASARLIATIDELLETIVNLKR